MPSSLMSNLPSMMSAWSTIVVAATREGALTVHPASNATEQNQERVL
jgi:hypothetical protein